MLIVALAMSVVGMHSDEQHVYCHEPSEDICRSDSASPRTVGMNTHLSDVWYLLRNDVLLGSFTVIGRDQPWFHAEFEPFAAFEQFRPLFDEERRILEQEPLNLRGWKIAYEPIRALGLRIERANSGARLDHVLLRVQGHKAEFRPFSDPEWLDRLSLLE